MTPFTKTLAAIDAANAQDPNQELANGEMRPKELIYGERMSARLHAFAPKASEHLQIAARGQHIERWRSPRSDYPEGRSGYKRWRAELGLFHAKRVGELMQESGYGDADIERVQYLVQKRGLRKDPETQCLEDVICLVFIEYYLMNFANKHSESKIIDIIQKTWNKMSKDGHQAALQLSISDETSALIGKALA